MSDHNTDPAGRTPAVEMVTSEQAQKQALVGTRGTLSVTCEAWAEAHQTIVALYDDNKRLVGLTKFLVSNSIHNECCIWCGMLEGEDHGTNYDEPCWVELAENALAKHWEVFGE